jgi:tetratricopeptide (TPR) repeat protein
MLDAAIEDVSASLSDPSSRSSRAAGAASDAAELFGSRGGLLRRMGRLSDALESYRSGAEIEYHYDLTATYNRTNAIKLALITGDRTVQELVPDIERLQAVLAERLSTDERAADDAWSWADLGDVRLLLGDDGGAESAYRTFAAKARTDSPAATLSVLWEIADALEAHGDGAAHRIMASISKAEAILS